MVHTIIWLTVLGVALLVPNVIAVRFALLGVGDAPAVVSVPAQAPAAERRRIAWSSPKFVRFGYLWKALSPIVLGVAVVMGMAQGGALGYGIMLLGLLNLIFGFLGWDAYIPGKK